MPVTLLLVLAVAALPARTVVISPAAAAKPIRIECPVDKTTRIVFPEPFANLKASAGGREAMGIVPEASRPRGVLRITPVTHPSKATVEVKGTTLSLTIVLQTVPNGAASEVRLDLEAAAPPAQSPVPTSAVRPVPAPRPTPATHAPEPQPSPQSVAATLVPEPPSVVADSPAVTPPQETASLPSVRPMPEPSPTPAPAQPATSVSSAPGLDLQALAVAEPTSIGRREGQPGRPAMVLQHALKGDRWVWLRFVLERGKDSQIEGVSWDRGELSSVAVRPMHGERDGQRVRPQWRCRDLLLVGLCDRRGQGGDVLR